MTVNLEQSVHRSRYTAETLWMCLAGILIFVAIMASLTHMQRSNNGDGWRMFRSAHVEMPADYFASRPFDRFIDFTPLNKVPHGYFLPLTPGAAVLQAVSLTERALQFKRFDFLYLSAVYAALYAAGIVLLLRRLHPVVVLPVVCVLLNPYVLAYFNSPYEESLYIALTPFLCYGLIDRMAVRGPATRGAVLIMAVAKIQFAPMVLFGLLAGKTRSELVRRNLVYGVLALLVIGFTVYKTNKFFEYMNGYNRYFNGLSYSMSGVSSWPVKHFIERNAAGPALVAQNSNAHLPEGMEPTKQYWGTSYWPTGTSIEPTTAAYIIQHQRAWYWQTVLANPRYLFRLATEPLLMTWRADYTMTYFFRTDLLDSTWLQWATLPMRYLGVIYLVCLASALVLAARRKSVRHVLTILFMLLYPLPVVYGDGYYEFEKHMFPMVLLGIVYGMTYVLQKESALVRVRSSS